MCYANSSYSLELQASAGYRGLVNLHGPKSTPPVSFCFFFVVVVVVFCFYFHFLVALSPDQRGAAPSGAANELLHLWSSVQWFSQRPVNSLSRANLVEFPFKSRMVFSEVGKERQREKKKKTKMRQVAKDKAQNTC